MEPHSESSRLAAGLTLSSILHIAAAGDNEQTVSPSRGRGRDRRMTRSRSRIKRFGRRGWPSRPRSWRDQKSAERIRLVRTRSNARSRMYRRRHSSTGSKAPPLNRNPAPFLVSLDLRPSELSHLRSLPPRRQYTPSRRTRLWKLHPTDLRLTRPDVSAESIPYHHLTYRSRRLYRDQETFCAVVMSR